MEFTRQDNISVLEWALKSTLTRLIDAVLIAQFPFLATPAVRQLMDLFIGDVIGKVIKNGDMMAFYVYTDLRASQQGRDFIKASQEHQLVLKGGTDAEKAKSEAELFEKFRNLAQLTT